MPDSFFSQDKFIPVELAKIYQPESSHARPITYKTGLVLEFFLLYLKLYVFTKFMTAHSTARLVVNDICHSSRRFLLTGWIRLEFLF